MSYNTIGFIIVIFPMVTIVKSDFGGITFKAMTHSYFPSIFIHENYTTTSQYFPENQTYEVTNEVDGLYFDILQTLQKELNFQTKLYKRNDNVLGFPTKAQNGTLIPNGALINIHEKSADFILATMFIHADRAYFVDFLDPLSITYYGIFISKDGLKSQMDYNTFLRPFSNEAWGAVCICCTTTLFTIGWTKVVHRSTFGHLGTLRFVLLIVTGFGNVLWIIYGGRLTSELAVRMTKMPFHDLPSLYDSNYKLIIGKPGTFSYAYFANTSLDSIEQKVFQRNVDLSVLTLSSHQKVQMVLEKKNVALFTSLASVPMVLGKDVCKVHKMLLPYIEFSKS